MAPKQNDLLLISEMTSDHTVTVTSGSSMLIMKRCRRLQGEKGKDSKEEGREGVWVCGVGGCEVKGRGRKPCVPCCVGSFLALLECNVRRVMSRSSAVAIYTSLHNLGNLAVLRRKP